MASIAMCEARRRDYRAIETWAQAHPADPAAGPVLAALNDEEWAVPLLSPAEVAAAYAAAARAGYHVSSAAYVERHESAEAVARATAYLRALG
jgi:hypothetical protein